MNNDLILYVGKRMMETALLVSAPVLIVAIVIGLITSILQAITSVRDMTMGMVLKLVGVGVTILLFGNWMLQIAQTFTVEIFQQVSNFGH